MRLESPCCIVPPVPPKTYTNKLQNAESEEVGLRKVGLEKFIAKVAKHETLGRSELLVHFLSEKVATFDYER